MDVQLRIRHQAMANAAAIKELGEFIDKMECKDRAAAEAAKAFDPKTVNLPPVRAPPIPPDGEAFTHSADEYREAGNSFFQQKDYAEALKYYQVATKVDPGMSTAYGNVGLCHQKLGDEDAALQAFTTALQLNPKYSKILVRRGRIYASRGQVTEAIEDLSAALPLLPEGGSGYKEVETELNVLHDKRSSMTLGKEVVIEIEEDNVEEPEPKPEPKVEPKPKAEPSISPTPVTVIPSKTTREMMAPTIPHAPTSPFDLYTALCHLKGYPEAMAEYLNSFHTSLLAEYVSNQLTEVEVKGVIDALKTHTLSPKKTINTLYALLNIPNLSVIARYLSSDLREALSTVLNWAMTDLQGDPRFQERLAAIRSDFGL
ncbi:Serine/threonine protein phosphatase 5 [Giardia muris]|uniref:RNA polymerase II-associated protein 3 n=1 Tax=Giardia muris TaxID=5742 RepID=A0A4Z1T4X3_GIAMU|nr:Serine/threonine protein phosphatase 5 [Giardia muris]|eukprot:TNJ29053.1 Serine/threonine protein phosphatase 5 [Giardia muris]